MNGYKFDLWQPIYHSDKFSHYVQRKVVIHSEMEKAARAAIETYLLPARRPVENIRVYKEFVYGMERLGKIEYETKIVYVIAEGGGE